MPLVAAHRLRGAGWSLEPERYERALRRAINETAKPDLIKLFEEVTAGKRYSNTGEAWEHDIAFRARLTFRGGDMSLYVYPSGPNKDLWTWTSQGTKAHSIDAKNAPFLVFPLGVQAKTKLPVGGGGLTQSLGGAGLTQWVRVKHVDHPGTKPRKFEERIAKEYGPKFRKLVHQTIERIVQEKNRPYVGSFGIKYA